MLAIDTGTLAEDVAILYLQQHNMLILQRNFRCKYGEIDLIVKDKDQTILIFTEVRYRENTLYGSPEESVTAAKQQKIIRAAEFYLQTRAWAQKVCCRFDVIAITGTIKTPQINWIKDAFHEYN